MKHTLAILILLTVLVPVAFAQSNLDICNANMPDTIESLLGKLADVTTMQGLIDFIADVTTYIDGCTAPEDSELGLSRSNPVPLGEWYPIEKGMVRFVSTRYDDENRLAVQTEYLCRLDDENATCGDSDVTYRSEYVTTEGRVVDLDFDFSSDALGGEVFSGVMLSGEIYFPVEIIDTPPNLIRFYADLLNTHMFFALNNVEEEP